MFRRAAFDAGRRRTASSTCGACSPLGIWLHAVGRLRRAGEEVVDPGLAPDVVELLAHRHAELFLEDVLLEDIVNFLRVHLDRLRAAFALQDHELVAQLNDAGELARLELKGDVFELWLATEVADGRNLAAERLAARLDGVLFAARSPKYSIDVFCRALAQTS